MESSVQKRKRKAFSCVDCRRRKLKCDREHPACSRCTKAGHADTCRYGSRSGDEEDEDDDENGERNATPVAAAKHHSISAHHPPANKHISNGTSERSAGQTKRIAQLEHRLAMLEGKPAASMPVTGRLDHAVPAKSLVGSDSKTVDSARREILGLLRGKGDPEPMIFRKKGFKVSAS